MFDVQKKSPISYGAEFIKHKMEIGHSCFCTVDERIQLWAEFSTIALYSVAFDSDR